VTPAAIRRLALTLLLPAAAHPVAAQQAPWVSVMGLAIGEVTSVERAPGGKGMTEARLTQPMVMVHAGALNGHLRFVGTLNLEGRTIPKGELLPGGWGEGYNDRRHPHTYAHELMVSGVDLLGRVDGGVRLSVSAGKGFVPFGSDDPMSRPVYRYPVNHHLSQLLERAVTMAGVRAGPVSLEAGLFNGDEPERPGQWPRLARFGDSWSARLTLFPVEGVELSGSRAKVHSPEHRPGAGTDAWKWHANARLDRPAAGGRIYALAEWARTEESNGFFVFKTLLLEGSYRRAAHLGYYRFERTDRPEDLRELDPFRSIRPHLENSILGITRFSLHTFGYGYVVGAAHGSLAIEPFLEGTIGTARNVGGGVLTPQILYGSSRVRSISGGVRLGWRMAGHRMGRYGRLDSAAGTSHQHTM
jgi:hypothetical protein